MKIPALLILAHGAAAQEPTVGDVISLQSLGHTAQFIRLVPSWAFRSIQVFGATKALSHNAVVFH